MEKKLGASRCTSFVLPVFKRTNETLAGSGQRLLPRLTRLAPLRVDLVPGFVLSLQELWSPAQVLRAAGAGGSAS